MDLSTQDVELAFQLAQSLWNVYRHGNRVLRGREHDPLEPMHSAINNTPEPLLTHLCSSLFWEQFHKEDGYQYAGNEAQFEFEHMGERRIRPVFVDERRIK